MFRPAPVADLIASVFKGTPAAQRLKEGVIWQVWQNAVGAQIASRAKPVAIRNGVLTVVVSSSPWLQQLNFLKAELRDKLNTAIGEELVMDIYLKAGSFKEEPSEPPPIQERKPRQLSRGEQEQISRTTAELGDQSLRDSLARLFARHLSSKDDPDE
jgi:hypothetical protein